MSETETRIEERLSVFKNDMTRERWLWVHRAIGHAKESNRRTLATESGNGHAASLVNFGDRR